MNKLQRLLVLTVCVTGVSCLPVIEPMANAQSQQTIEWSSKQALNRADRLNQQVVALYQQGRYADAIPLAQESLSIFEAVLGTDYPLVAVGLNNLAGLHRAQGNYEAALPLYERALSILENTLGHKHQLVSTY